MKSTKLRMLLTGSAVAVLALTSSCSRREDKEVPTPKTVETLDEIELHVKSGAEELDTGSRETGEEIEESAAEVKEKLVIATRNTLDALGQKLDELERMLAEEQADMHADTREAVARLKQERAKVAADLEGAESIGEDKWDAFVNDTRRAMDKLEAGYNQVLENMKIDNE